MQDQLLMSGRDDKDATSLRPLEKQKYRLDLRLASVDENFNEMAYTMRA